MFYTDLLYVHFKGCGDVRRMLEVPVAVETFRVGVGPTGDHRLPGENYNKKKQQLIAGHNYAEFKTVIFF